MNLKQPLISIIMPVHNAGQFLAPALNSIISQTYTNWELICIDDSSTDSSLSTIKEYQSFEKRIKILQNKKKSGIGYCLNKGLKKAKGEFIARMDADDISLPERFAKQVHLLKTHKDLVACGGQIAMINAKGAIFAHKKFPLDSKTLYSMIMKMVPIQHPLLVAKASVLKSFRYFENLTTGEDVDMLFYLLSKGNISNVDSVIYQYRKHDTSNGYHNVKKTFAITFESRFRAIKKYGYKPSLKGILVTFGQYIIVNTLPSKMVVEIFEAIRFEPPFWEKQLNALFSLQNVMRLIQPTIR